MHAVIFRAEIKELDEAYAETAARLRDLAINDYGCLEFTAVSEGQQEIAESYWENLDQIKARKQNPEHRTAQKLGAIKVVQILSGAGCMKKLIKIFIIAFCFVIFFASYYFYTRKDITYSAPGWHCKKGKCKVSFILENKATNHERLYLYCSGTLPQYDEKLGWRRTEVLEYCKKTRIIMEVSV